MSFSSIIARSTVVKSTTVVVSNFGSVHIPGSLTDDVVVCIPSKESIHPS